MKNKVIIIITIVFLCCSTTACCIHHWVDATCTEPKHCTRCGETEGEELQHDIEWITTSIATCNQMGLEEGVCSRCGKKIKRSIPMVAHTEGTWTITKEATFETPGEKELTCSVCGCTLDSESYDLPPDEKELQYKQACENYEYEDLARNPDTYVGTYTKVYGKIIQVIEFENGYVEMRIATKKNYGEYYDDIIYTSYQRKEGESRYLENDLITIYGLNSGVISYESVMAGTITIPYVEIEYIVMGNDK